MLALHEYQLRPQLCGLSNLHLTMTNEDSAQPLELPSGLIEPTSAEKLPPYPVAFRQCVEVSRRLQPRDDLGSLRPVKRSSRGFSKQVTRGLAEAGLKPEHFAGAPGQPLKWSVMLAPAIAKVTGLQAWPTIGQLWAGSHRILGLTWEQLRELASHGVHANRLAAMGLRSLNWHAWVTLESGQIVDLTFPSTLARHSPLSFGQFAGTILCGLEFELIRHHRYFPMIAGGAAIHALQDRSSMPLIGKGLDDLLRYSVARVDRLAS